MIDLRTRLSRETQFDHQRVDDLFSGLDLTDHTDLGRFLSAHRAAFDTIVGLSGVDAPIREPLRRVLDALDSDLAGIGLPVPPRVGPVDSDPLDDDALAYLFHGSRMGTKVLRRRWQQSRDPAVVAAQAYFSVPTDMQAWRDLVAHLARRSGEGIPAERTLADAKRIFGIFERAIAAHPPSAKLLKGFVLVVEDNPVIAMDTADLLVELGAARVATAHTAAVVTEILAKQRPTIAVLDVTLGSGTSLSAANALAAEEVPFLLVTGHSRNDEILSQFPKAPVLHKPYTAARMALALRLLLNRRTSQQKAI